MCSVAEYALEVPEYDSFARVGEARARHDAYFEARFRKLGDLVLRNLIYHGIERTVNFQVMGTAPRSLNKGRIPALNIEARCFKPAGAFLTGQIP